MSLDAFNSVIVWSDRRQLTRNVKPKINLVLLSIGKKITKKIKKIETWKNTKC